MKEGELYRHRNNGLVVKVIRLLQPYHEGRLLSRLFEGRVILSPSLSKYATKPGDVCKFQNYEHKNEWEKL